MPGTFRILLIDDDPLLIDILIKAAHQGFPEAAFSQVYSVAEAKNYINQLQGYALNLILLDLDLGEPQSGLDFLTYLRSHAQASPLPVISLSASEIPLHIRKAYDLGASSFTTKPFSQEDWVLYLIALRQYWLKTVSLPKIIFCKPE